MRESLHNLIAGCSRELSPAMVFSIANGVHLGVESWMQAVDTFVEE